MAQVVAYVNYISPVERHQGGAREARPRRSRATRSSSRRRDVLARAQVFRGLTPAEETKYSKRFSASRRADGRRDASGDLTLVGISKSFETVHRGRTRST